MEKLDSLESEMKDDISELDEARDIKDTLQRELEEIDRKFDEIIDHLDELEGDAAESVKQELQDEKEQKSKTLDERINAIESKERELNEKLQQIEEALSERHAALSAVQDLGKNADIDVSDAVNDINDEISRLEEDRNGIHKALSDK